MKTIWCHPKQFALSPFLVASVVLLAPLFWGASAAAHQPNTTNTTYVMPLSAHDLRVDQRYETFVHVAE